MAKMIPCDCGWTIISPQGEADVKKHAMIHVKDAHPGMNVTDEHVLDFVSHNVNYLLIYPEMALRNEHDTGNVTDLFSPF